MPEGITNTPKWIFQSLKGSKKYYDLPSELPKVLSLDREKRIVHWEDAEVRQTEHGESFPMELGDLVLLYQGGEEERGLHGLARIDNLYGPCLVRGARHRKGYTHKLVRRGPKGRKHQLGVDLRYIERFNPRVAFRRELTANLRNKKLASLGTGRLFEGTVHSLTRGDFLALSAETDGRLERLVGAALPELRRSQFTGFSDTIFEACDTGTSKIIRVVNQLELLRQTIEPKLQEMDDGLRGIVSRPKKEGTNIYQDWAWLMFTHARLGKLGKPKEANELTQLSVNIGSHHLFVGLCLRRRRDAKVLRGTLQADSELFRGLIESLGREQWIITGTDQDFGEKAPGNFEASELSIALLNPKLKWINARFEKGDELVKRPDIAHKILDIFAKLYPLYALSLGLEAPVDVVQVEPSEEETEDVGTGSEAKDDEELLKQIEQALKNLGKGKAPDKTNIPGKTGGHFVPTPTLPLNSIKRSIDCTDGRTRACYLAKGFSSSDVDKRASSFDDFRSLLDRIAGALGVDSNFLQVIVTDQRTDARYLKEGGIENSCVVANLLRYDKNKQDYFWLVTICREVAYILTGRLGYGHQIKMRQLLMKALPSFSTLVVS